MSPLGSQTHEILQAHLWIVDPSRGDLWIIETSSHYYYVQLGQPIPHSPEDSTNEKYQVEVMDGRAVAVAYVPSEHSTTMGWADCECLATWPLVNSL